LGKKRLGRAKLTIKRGAGGRSSKKSAGGRRQEAEVGGQKADLYARLATVDDPAAGQCAELRPASALSVRTIHEVTRNFTKKKLFFLSVISWIVISFLVKPDVGARSYNSNRGGSHDVLPPVCSAEP
jgi:hypothetical protein